MVFPQPPDSLSRWGIKLNPARRFESAGQVTIGRAHPNPSALSQGSIKVLSWNIAKSTYDAGWIEDFLTIVEQHQPDKIFLQEVRLCALSEEIPELAHMGWHFAPNFIDKAKNAYSGVLIATKDNPIRQQALVTQHAEPVSNTPKVSLFAEYSLENGDESLLAVNTHLINFVELSKFKAQLEAVAVVLRSHPGKIIFSGDFNTWNRARYSMLHKMTARLGLKSVTFTAADTQKIKSFLLSPPLDYIFYRGFYQKPLSAKVLDNFAASDHNPLLVEFCA
ncbi:MAG: endonuclease/exonuclease/phosphatase family protein [Phormidesmis sp.]